MKSWQLLDIKIRKLWRTMFGYILKIHGFQKNGMEIVIIILIESCVRQIYILIGAFFLPTKN